MKEAIFENVYQDFSNIARSRLYEIERFTDGKVTHYKINPKSTTLLIQHTGKYLVTIVRSTWSHDLGTLKSKKTIKAWRPDVDNKESENLELERITGQTIHSKMFSKVHGGKEHQAIRIKELV